MTTGATLHNAAPNPADALDLLDRPAWWPDAACRYLGDRDLYLTAESTETIFFDPDGINTALAVCHRCPAMSECLARSVRQTEPGGHVGVCGGMTARKRERYAGALRANGLLDEWGGPVMPEPIVSSRIDSRIAGIVAKLDELGVPIDATAKAAKYALTAAGLGCRKERLLLALKRRRIENEMEAA